MCSVFFLSFVLIMFSIFLHICRVGHTLPFFILYHSPVLDSSQSNPCGRSPSYLFYSVVATSRDLSRFFYVITVCGFMPWCFCLLLLLYLLVCWHFITGTLYHSLHIFGFLFCPLIPLTSFSYCLLYHGSLHRSIPPFSYVTARSVIADLVYLLFCVSLSFFLFTASSGFWLLFWSVSLSSAISMTPGPHFFFSELCLCSFNFGSFHVVFTASQYVATRSPFGCPDRKSVV